MVRGFQRELSVMNRNLFIRLLLLAGAHAARITLLPWQDTTIYEPNAQQSNMEIGGGNSVFLVAGLTGNSLERRALLQFDLNVLPANAKVTSASLELHFDKSKEASLSVFRLTSTWTAGKETVNNSHAGQGSLAINGSSWNIRDANGQSWQQPGGDYATPATDAQSFGESAKDIIFNVTADVLAMLGDVDNYGWIIAATDANATGSAVRLYSSEYDNFSLRPALTIEFQPQRQHNFACFHRFANAADCNNIEVEEQSVRCEAVDECVAIDGYLSMVQSCTEEGAVDVQMYAGSTPCSAEPISTNIYEDNECTLHLEKHGYFTCEKRSLNPSTTEAPTKTTTSPALASSVASQSTTTQSGSKKVYDICVERYASDSCPSGMQLSSRCERQARCQSEATGRSTTYRCLDGVVEVETFEGSETCDGVPTKTQNLTESACVELAPTFAKIECVPKIIPVDKVELSLEATHDATLFQTANINETSLASGGDDAIFVGRTRQRAGIALRRSVIGFDLTRLTLPEGELVKAELVLSVVRVSQNAPDEATTITAHRVTSAWVEGNNSASGTNSAIDPNGGAGGTGVNATAGATWYYSDLVASTTWATPGGDYETDSSSFGTVEESKRLVLSNLQDDVKDMVSNPSRNYGWLLRAADEDATGSGNALRIASSEAERADQRPVLVLTFLVESVSTSTTTMTEIDFTTMSQLSTDTEPADGRTAQPTELSSSTVPQPSTTRTAASGMVFVRSTYSVQTNVGRHKLAVDIAALVRAEMEAASIGVGNDDVVVLVQQDFQTRRQNNWRATVFVQVAQSVAQATMEALQKIQDDGIIAIRLKESNTYPALTITNLEAPTTVSSTGMLLGMSTSSKSNDGNHGVVAVVVVLVICAGIGAIVILKRRHDRETTKSAATVIHNPNYAPLYEHTVGMDYPLADNDDDDDDIDYVVGHTNA
eukprot:TRINITY_DN12198_c0_g1_i3.p1 TRINITY_DN12198_c0_g1~~TRINITY_DN12198_c0_g1_i3.p1  ORF type:complete len:942 (+),score=196.95 TRINITY_DN12198_c0_g1_i3:2071-4896(+)